MTVTLADNQKVTITVIPEDADSQPTTLAPGTFSAASGNTGIVTIGTTTATTFDIVALAEGSTTVTVNCLTSAGTVAFSASLDVVVNAGIATQYSFGIGTPVSQ